MPLLTPGTPPGKTGSRWPANGFFVEHVVVEQRRRIELATLGARREQRRARQHHAEPEHRKLLTRSHRAQPLLPLAAMRSLKICARLRMPPGVSGSVMIMSVHSAQH